MKNKLQKDKKGSDKIISVYWFAILILVAGGIFAMVYVFYSGSYDVRDIEANILADKVADCFSEAGYLKNSVFNEGSRSFLLDESNFLEMCGLNFNVEDKWDEEQYFIEVNIYNLGNLVNPVFQISKGNKNWKGSCELQDDGEYEKLVKCVNKRFYSLDLDKNQYLIDILSIVRKSEKNVKE